MLTRIVTPEAERLLATERTLLMRLRRTLEHCGIDSSDLHALERSVEQLDQLFLLVVVGEFNAGKSAFINALLGAPVLVEGVTPTTTHVQIVRHGAETRRADDGSVTDVITAPLDLLRDMDIVDTPGTNAIHQAHAVITADFVPRSDLVLFVTSADRPFTESERSFLEDIRGWGKKVVIVINKIDILTSSSDIERVVDFVAAHATTLLGLSPQIFPISARRALQGKTSDAPVSPVPGDRFADLEHYIAETLDQRERLHLKLLNPVGVGRRLMQESRAEVDRSTDLLREDAQTLDDVTGQLDQYREDLSREFRLRLAEIDTVLLEFERRGIAFFEDTLRLARVVDLMNRSKLKQDFEHQVVKNTPQRVEQSVQDLIDWMIASELSQWQAVIERVRQRTAAHPERPIGGLGDVAYDRTRLLETVGREASRAIESYDREKEASAMAESVRAAVAGTALAEVGAVGLGTVVSLLASTTFADVTGLLAASAMAVLGLLVIPMRRRRATKELRERIARLREQLMTALTSQFEREVRRSVSRIEESVAPYSRFVRAETERLATVTQELDAIGRDLEELTLNINRL